MAALKKEESPLCPVDDVKSHHMTLLLFISASGCNLEKLHIISTVKCFSKMPKFTAHSNNFVFHKTKNGSHVTLCTKYLWIMSFQRFNNGEYKMENQITQLSSSQTATAHVTPCLCSTSCVQITFISSSFHHMHPI